MQSKSYGFLVPLVSVLAGVYWIYASVTEYGIYGKAGPETGFYPVVVASALVVVGLVLLVAGGGETKGFKPVQLLPVAGIALVLIAGHFIGTLPALFLFLLVWIKKVAKYSLRFSLVTSAAGAFVVWLVFRYAVSVQFQDGILWELFK